MGRGHNGVMVVRPHRPRAIVALEGGSLLAFATYAGWLAGRLFEAASGALDGAALLVSALAGWLLADLLSGLVHWAGDTLGSEHTPILGPSFIAPFREHHEDPQAMVAHGTVELVGSTALLALPSLVPVTHLVAFEGRGPLRLALGGLLLTTLLGVVATNLVHRWAHMDRPPAPIALLQRTGLILTPARHDRHHTAPFDGWFCISSGLLDPILMRVGLWGALRRILGRA